MRIGSRIVAPLILIMSTVIALPVHANNANLVDETKPIALYCDSTLYACNGYGAPSDEQYLPTWAPAFKNVRGTITTI